MSNEQRMLKNFVTIALRNISKHRIYAVINILGLSIGVTCSLLLLLYINHELGYDKFNENGNRIYRIVTKAQIQDTKLHAPVTMAPLGPALQHDYSEVEQFVRLTGSSQTLVTNEQIKFYEEKFYFTDSSFFKVFDFDLIQGNPTTCLQHPNTIVLSETTAKKYFGNENPIGKLLTIETPGMMVDKEVTGVMKDAPNNSHITPNALLSYTSLPEQQRQFWASLNDYTYLLLRAGTKPDVFEKNFPDVYDKYISELFSQFNAEAEFYLQPIFDIHLNSNLDGEIEPTGDIYYIYIFSAIALFVLVVACINYMNLATARSTNRAKEVGIRKAMGSYKSQLIGQFIAESFILTILAVVISAMIVFFLIPEFNVLSGKDISQNFIADPQILGILIGMILFVGFLGGSYPAFHLSNLRIAEILGRNTKSARKSSLRKVLVILQFSISLFMIISTWVVFDQLSYLENKDLGFTKDRVIRVLLNGEDVRNKYDVLKNQLANDPRIESIGSCWATPGGGNYSMNATTVESNTGELISKVFPTISVDHDFLPTLEIPVVEGRNFKHEIASDTSNSIIVNQELVDHMGWDEPIGKKFHVIINPELETREAKVIGVVQNFHLRALQEPIEPLVIHNSIGNGNMIVRIAADRIPTSIKYIKDTWHSVVKNKPLQYSFIEQDFNEQYQADEKRGQVFAIFSVLTIVISCLGLFGLASYTAETKRKEIGIRKVIGASTHGIVFMMSKDFLKLVAIAIVISFPVAYYFMDQWLSEFAFRDDINYLTFMLSALITTAITFLTVSYHSLTAASSNPTTALREQ